MRISNIVIWVGYDNMAIKHVMFKINMNELFVPREFASGQNEFQLHNLLISVIQMSPSGSLSIRFVRFAQCWTKMPHTNNMPNKGKGTEKSAKIVGSLIFSHYSSSISTFFRQKKVFFSSLIKELSLITWTSLYWLSVDRMIF